MGEWFVWGFWLGERILGVVGGLFGGFVWVEEWFV